jgi:hypothetical protein
VLIARGSEEGGGGEEAELQAGLAITKSCKALVKEVTVLRKRASAGTYAHAPSALCLVSARRSDVVLPLGSS